MSSAGAPPDAERAASVSACLIVRDEAALLGDCLASLQGWVQELCVLDTGSTDETLAIAREHGARVGSFAWCDDFSAARNACLELASGDWVLVIDADERLVPASGPALAQAVRGSSQLAYLVQLENVAADGRRQTVWLPRLFRRRAEIRFRRTVHESVLESLRELGHGAPAECGVRLEHIGYQPEILATRDKHARNARLLAGEAAAHPDDLYVQYKLALTLRGARREEEAVQAFERALSLLEQLAQEERAEYPYAGLAAAGALQLRTRSGELDLAVQLEQRARACGLVAPELELARGELALARGAAGEAERHFRAALDGPPSSSYSTADPVALAARAARGRLRAVLAREPASAEAELALRAARAARAPHADPAVEVCGVRIEFARGDMQAGLTAFAHWLDQFPSDPEIGLLAGEIGWAQGETQVALETWRRVADSTPAGQAARARALLAEIAVGDLEAARRNLGELRPVDVESAATGLLGALVLGVEPKLERCLDAELLLTSLGGQLGELLAVGAEQAVECFARGAAGRAELLAGIDQLIVCD